MRKPVLVFLLLILLAATGLGNLAPAATAAGIPDPRFGVVQAYEAPGAASELGAGWERITFYWNEMQPNSPDEWISSISDEQLAAELAAGRQVVGLLVNVPGWATDLEIGSGVPQGLYLDHNDPNNLWANFVRSIVGRYAGRIDHWIIGNEPDIWESQHMTWGGSVADFAQLMRVSYAVVKETNPNAVVHLAAMSHWWDADYGRELYFRRLLQAITADPNAATNNYYFDVASMHIYFKPEDIYDLTTLYAGLMGEFGVYKPIWIVETDAPPSQDPAWPVPHARFQVSLEDQATFIVQALALGIAAGAQRIAVYKMVDTERDRTANPEPFGLVRMDGSRRPAFTAYQMAATYLAGFRSASWDRRDDVAQVTVDRGEQTTTVVWSRQPVPQTVWVPARTRSALLVDIWGGAHIVYPERGYYILDLGAASCTDPRCLMGGPPLMLVEQARVDAPTHAPPATPTPPSPGEETARPTATATATVTPTATPTPTPTATPTRTPTPTPTPTATPTPTPTVPALGEMLAPLFDPPPPTVSRPWLLAGVLVASLSIAALLAGLRRT